MILTRDDVRRLLDLDDCIAAVAEVFRKSARGEIAPAGVLSMHAEGGGFHVKAAMLDDGERRWFAAKTNANFPGNAARFGLPTIQGVVLLFDAIDGRPLAVLDSIELTALRTAAATAVAARHLARPSSSTVTICGCGAQSAAQLLALARVLPVAEVFAFDIDEKRAAAFVREMAEAPFAVKAVDDLRAALRASDVVVTCTTSRRAFLMRDDVMPGTFIAAVGADNPEKSELDPLLMAGSKVVVDSIEQCAAFGDLHHAIDAGVMSANNVYASLGEIVAGDRPGRTNDNEITIFDSTGTAIQDVAAAVLVYKRSAGVSPAVRGASRPGNAR
ncbi:MAG TPA: ornithine cyclodeaminase family protein, partial [Thermoanaerobaculia bacterium]|jgi:ornithine cyclodeaminase/alanine dehydrogenase-like protein (mu-crystallin family)|nr:ornithine cyclodeaminase family protein [Thermoanaerobaculia bacterium]